MIRTLLSCRRGSAIVEAALIMPFVLTLGFAAADAGALMSESHRMKAGLAAGARFLARAKDPATVEEDARNIAVTGSRTSGGTPRVKGWTAAQVTISYRIIPDPSGAYAGGGDVKIIRLTSQRSYTGLGLLRLAGAGPITLRATHEERWTS